MLTDVMQKMRSHIWMGIYCELPEDWEILQFSKKAPQGRIAWADRYQYRLELNWRKAEGAPEYTRLLDDYRSQFEKDESIEWVNPIENGGWRGFEVRTEALHMTRLLNYLPENEYLLECIFLWPEGRDIDLELSILSSIRSGLELDGDNTMPRHWNVFGLDLKLGIDWPLNSCMVKPAATTMRFKPHMDVAEEKTFTRLGMVKDWLVADVESWLKLQLPKKTTIHREETLHLSNHTIAVMEGVVKGKSHLGTLTRKLKMRTAAWICPHDGRLFHFSSVTLPKKPVNECITCCDELTIKGEELFKS